MPSNRSDASNGAHPLRATLIALDGPAPGRVYVLRADRVTIGRADDNNLALHDVTVSRHHASVRRADDGRWWLRDEASVSGVRLNGANVLTEAPLADGDEIGLGQVTLVFHVG